MKHLTDKRFVHRGLPTMGVKVACCEFHGFAQHHAKGYFPDVQFVSHLQGLADIVAVFHKRLLGQVRVEGFHESFTLASAVDDDTTGATGLGHSHALADAVDEGFFAEWFYDARDTDNRYSTFDTHRYPDGD